MSPEHYASRLEDRGIHPTAMRLLVYRTLAESRRALSLRELCDMLVTAERSTVFRTLTLLLAHHLAHAIEDGTGVARYEACEGHDDCSPDDQHTHFFCTRCQRTFCFRSIHVPVVTVPDGFTLESVNYLVKGICPDCQRSA